MLVTITAGMAKITITLTTSIAHTKSGIRLSDIPGVRNLRMVQIRQTATTSDDTSVNVISCAQTSARLP